MSGRFVRASKYRHVAGIPAKKEKSFLGTAKAETTSDGNCIAASTAYFAIAMQGGGGPVLVWSHKAVGRIPDNAPKINVHKNKVTDMDFSPFVESLLATASDDQCVKVSMIPAGGLKADLTDPVQSLIGHNKKVTLVRWHPTATGVLASSSYDQTVKVWDVEKGTEALSFNEANSDVPISIEWNEDGSQLASVWKDKMIRIYDPRVKNAVVKTQGLEGPKGARVVWIHGQNRLLTCGDSKTKSRMWQLYDSKKWDTPLSTGELDNNPGALIPHYDPDNSILYLTGKGDAALRYYEVTQAEEPHVHALAEFRDTESTKGACFLPKSLMDTKICEVAIMYRVMKDAIMPVSLQVPRKSELFQGDIYPDTNACKPVATGEEYFAGTNRQPLKKSMKPGSAAPDSKVAVSTNFQKAPEAKAAPSSSSSSSSSAAAAGPTVAELQKELAAAQARIKELEDQVNKLKAGGSS